ncbi:MAG: hypothetical protein WAU91_02575 [Desulfatitalea sp.]
MGLHSLSIDNGFVVALISLIVVILCMTVRAIFLAKPRKKPVRPVQTPQPEEQSQIKVVPGWGGYDSNLFGDLSASATICKSIAEAVGEPFKLAVLYHQLEMSNWPHPHLTIRSLREAELLMPAGNGLFAWSKI